jgi:hypothetical protein
MAQKTKIECPCRTGQDTNGLLPLFKTVNAHIALLHLDPNLIALKNRRTIGTDLITLPTSITFLPIDEHSTILGLLVQGLRRTMAHADRLLTMITGNPLKMNPYIGKAPFLILIDP